MRAFNREVLWNVFDASLLCICIAHATCVPQPITSLFSSLHVEMLYR